jgi:hypothetical protein
MDCARFDALVGMVRRSQSRRGAVVIAALALFGGAWSGVAQPIRVETPRRRNACHVRCGLARRLCKLECRDLGAAERECKKLCRVARDGCFLRCEYRSLRERYATRNVG